MHAGAMKCRKRGWAARTERTVPRARYTKIAELWRTVRPDAASLVP